MLLRSLLKSVILFIGSMFCQNILLAGTDKIVVAGGCFWCVEAVSYTHLRAHET